MRGNASYKKIKSCFMKQQRIYRKINRFMKKHYKQKGFSQSKEIPCENKKILELLEKVKSLSKKAYETDPVITKQLFPSLALSYLDSICKNNAITALGYDWGKAGDPEKISKLREYVHGNILGQLDEVSPKDRHTLPKENGLLFKIYPGIKEYICVDNCSEAVIETVMPIKEKEAIRLALEYLGYQTVLR